MLVWFRFPVADAVAADAVAAVVVVAISAVVVVVVASADFVELVTVCGRCEESTFLRTEEGTKPNTPCLPLATSQGCLDSTHHEGQAIFSTALDKTVVDTSTLWNAFDIYGNPWCFSCRAVRFKLR